MRGTSRAPICAVITAPSKARVIRQLAREPRSRASCVNAEVSAV